MKIVNEITLKASSNNKFIEKIFTKIIFSNKSNILGLELLHKTSYSA